MHNKIIKELRENQMDDGNKNKDEKDGHFDRDKESERERQTEGRVMYLANNNKSRKRN